MILAWGLLGDRSRGRCRCPKCWYDLSSTEPVEGAWTCSECGKLSRSEKKLHKPRRRRRWIAGALALQPLAYAIWATPRFREEGWTGAVPTTVALLGMDLLRPEITELAAFDKPHSILEGEDPRTLLYKNMRERIQAREFPRWQLELLLWQSRRAAGDPKHARWALCKSLLVRMDWYRKTKIDPWWSDAQDSLVHLRFYTRRAWAPGQEIYVRYRLEQVSFPGFDGHGFHLDPLDEGLTAIEGSNYFPIASSFVSSSYGDQTVSLGALSKPSARLQYNYTITRREARTERAQWPILHQGTLTLPTIVVENDVDAPKPHAADLQSIAMPVQRKYFGRSEPRMYLSLQEDSPFKIEQVAFAGTAELRLDGELVDRFSFHTEMFVKGNDTSAPFFFALLLDHVPERLIAQGNYTIRLKGDPLIAMRRIEATSYWDGVIELPIE